MRQLLTCPDRNGGSWLSLKLKRKRAKRAILAAQRTRRIAHPITPKSGALGAPGSRGSLRSFAAQRRLAQDDNFKLSDYQTVLQLALLKNLAIISQSFRAPPDAPVHSRV